MAELYNIDNLRLQLEQQDSNTAWYAALAIRAAMRALPYGLPDPNKGDWVSKFTLVLIRSLVLSQAVIGIKDAKIKLASEKASDKLQYTVAADSAPYALRASARNAAYLSFGRSSSRWSNLINDEPENNDWYLARALSSVDHAIHSVDEPALHWSGVGADLDWLRKNSQIDNVERRLMSQKLWIRDGVTNWRNVWEAAKVNLLQSSSNSSIWIDWYERRIRGERAAFDIPGDKRLIEDKKILRRLAEATDADFWGKGHEYVNATLKGWLDEARARVAPPLPEIEAEIEIPSPEPHAIAYGMNIDGMIDRLPFTDQKHLQDTPQQRRAYGDIRELANALLDENQRLGLRLYVAMERFCGSLPDSFEEADTYLLWRDGNALRRLYLAHRKVEARNEPDEARLEAVVAEMLGGLLDLYNVFAFADDGLRTQDEDRITLQERADGKAEAMAAAPIIRAILEKPELASEAALQDIKAEVENAKLPVDDPYADQALVQSNRINRNLMVGVLKWMNESFGNPNTFRGAVAVSVTGSAMVAGGATLFGVAGGTNFLPMLEFVAVQASPLQHYVSMAYSSYPHLPELIERAKAIWQHFSGKV